MSWTGPVHVSAGQAAVAADYNAQVIDNMLWLYGESAGKLSRTLFTLGGWGNNNSEIDVCNISIAGHALGMHGFLLHELWLEAQNSSGGSLNLTLRYYYGGTCMLSPVLAIGNSSAAPIARIFASFWLHNVVVEGLQYGHLILQHTLAPQSDSQTALAVVAVQGMRNACAENSYIARNFRVSCQWASASPNTYLAIPEHVMYGPMVFD